MWIFQAAIEFLTMENISLQSKASSLLQGNKSSEISHKQQIKRNLSQTTNQVKSLTNNRSSEISHKQQIK